MKKIALAYVALCLFAAVAIADGSGSAAPAVPAVPEPSVESASLVAKLWKGGAILPAIVVAAYLLLSVASKKFAWFKTGKRAAYVAGALSFLTAIVGTAASGSTPNASMLLAALGSAVALVMHPVQDKAQA